MRIMHKNKKKVENLTKTVTHRYFRGKKKNDLSSILRIFLHVIKYGISLEKSAYKSEGEPKWRKRMKVEISYIFLLAYRIIFPRLVSNVRFYRWKKKNTYALIKNNLNLSTSIIFQRESFGFGKKEIHSIRTNKLYRKRNLNLNFICIHV